MKIQELKIPKYKISVNIQFSLIPLESPLHNFPFNDNNGKKVENESSSFGSEQVAILNTADTIKHKLNSHQPLDTQ